MKRPVKLLHCLHRIYTLSRRGRVTDLAREAVGGSLAGKRTAVLGIAFKPNSDDIRDSPSLDICGRLAAEGAIVSVHDPVAMPNAARTRPDLRYAASASEAAEGADVVLHLTEWADYPGHRPGRGGHGGPPAGDYRRPVRTRHLRLAGSRLDSPGPRTAMSGDAVGTVATVREMCPKVRLMKTIWNFRFWGNPRKPARRHDDGRDSWRRRDQVAVAG
jgi:UDP-glucose/GDP-mannose dehydrogenase family, UDP binding domain